MPDSRWDVVVVGAGPAGSMAASGILRRKSDAKVLILEKRRKVGHPYQCAGGIVDFWLKRFGLDPPKMTTASTLKGFRIYATDGSYVEGTGLHGAEGDEVSGRILDRVAFDQWLASRAQKDGAVLKLRHSVTGATEKGLEITAPEEGVLKALKGVKKVKGTTGHIKGYLPLPQYLICADGWASRTAAFLGVDTTVPPGDMYRTLQYTVPVKSAHRKEKAGGGKKGDVKKGKREADAGRGGGRLRAGGATEGGLDLATLDREFAAFIFGRSISPSAYAWAFPEGGRSDDHWRIGTGHHQDESGLRGNLERFIDERITGAGPPREVVGGWIPVGKPPKTNAYKIGGTEMYLTGDAARIVCPLTGGGLANAFFSGDLSGECIVTGSGLGDYNKRLRAATRKDLVRKYKLKKIFFSWSDEEIGRVIRAMGDFKPSSGNPRRELGALVRHVMWKEPRLFMSMIGGMLRY